MRRSKIKQEVQPRLEDIESLSFDQALKELEKIVQKLEEGGDSLEESLALFERGVKLARFCEAKLEAAEQKVKQLVVTEEGEVKFEEFDVEE